MKKRVAFAVAILAILAAVGILLYPIISTSYNDAHQSKMIFQHREEVEQVPDERIQKMRAEAAAYNKALQPITEENYSSEMLSNALNNYKEQLDLVGDGIIGYVDIPKIHVYLPIYHGTNENTLEIGVGHLLGSSLPIGGVGTHTVLTAHSGMASRKMFSDLPQMKIGDVFYIHVLDEVLAYKVDGIHTVLPYDMTYLGIETEKDQCTLVTCTPFGVNTHRLLVRGQRVPYEPTQTAESPESETSSETQSNWEQEYVRGIVYGLILAVLILLICLGIRIWRTHHEKA